MKFSLDGCKAKTARAAQHLETLDAEIKSFINSGAYGVVGYLNEQTGWKEIDFEIHREPPVEWGLFVGDFAHNTRSALDQLVYQLSGGKNGTQFPILLSADDYFEADRCGRTRRGSMLRGVSPENRAIIDSYQPFHRTRQQMPNDPLARLNWLNNADKHRLIHSSFTMFSRFLDLDVEFLDSSASTYEFEVLPDPRTVLKHGTKLYKIRVGPDPAAKVNVESKLPLRIGFGKGAPRVETSDLARVLDHVRDIIMRFA